MMFYILSRGLLTFVLRSLFSCIKPLATGSCAHSVPSSFAQRLCLLCAFVSSLLHLLHFHFCQLAVVLHGDVAVGHQCLSESSLFSTFAVKEFISKGFPFNWSYSESVVRLKIAEFPFSISV